MFFMVGCSSTTYDYIAPTTAEGLQCTAKCNMIYDGCIAREQQRAYDEQAQCERLDDAPYWQCLTFAEVSYDNCLSSAERSYRDCLRYSNNALECYSQRSTCEMPSCTPRNCSVAPDKRGCLQRFNTCFTSCGGEVIEVE